MDGLLIGALATSTLAVPAAAREWERAIVRSTVAAAGAAVALLIGVYTLGPQTAQLRVGEMTMTATADRLTSVLLVLVLGLAAVVQRFSCRYLRGDTQRRRILTGIAVVCASTALMVTSGTLALFACAWTTASIAVWWLLRGANGTGARRARRATTATFLLSDAALWTAVTITAVSGGGELGGSAAFPGGRAGSLVAVLLVLAAVGRSALVPLHRWLPATTAAPTPLSALLHAGVVNAGGILLLRTAPGPGEGAPAMWLAFGLGALTMVLGTAMMLTRPDVKGALAHSTVAQMGFLIVACSVGAYAAAVVHLVGHALYKATLFLGSGSGVERLVRARKAPPAGPSSWRLPVALLATAAPALVLIAAAWFLPKSETAAATLGLFVWASAVAAAAGWTRQGGGWMRPIAGLIALTAGYACAIAAAHLAVNPALPQTAPPVPTWSLLGVLAALGGVAWLRTLDSHHRWAPLSRRAYTWALAAGDPLTPLRGASLRSDAVPASGGPPASPAASDLSVSLADRVSLRADVAVAAAVLSPAWPLATFVGVNPLGGLVHRRFEQALTAAGAAFGARGSLDESAFRQAYAQGRVQDHDLLTALTNRHPGVAAGDTVTLDGHPHTPLDLLRCDLLHGAAAPDPQRRLRTLIEQVDVDTAELVDAHVARWCAAALDTGQAGWAMPAPKAGLWSRWRALVEADPTLPRTVRARLAGMPAVPEDALLQALNVLGVGLGGERLAHLRAHLLRMPGWATHLVWRADTIGDVDLVDYLAIRVSYEAAVLGGRPSTAPVPAQDRGGPTAMMRAAEVAHALGCDHPSSGELAAVATVLAGLPVEARTMVWLEAYEGNYRERMLAALAAGEVRSTGAPRAQIVCCIDVRSEGLRRHLEAIGNYETLGYAGFFGVPIRFSELADGEPDDLCPVLIRPSHTVRETPLAAEGAARYLNGRAALARADHAVHAAKGSPAAGFALAEVGGLILGPIAALRTFAPAVYAGLRERVLRMVAPPPVTAPSVEQSFTLAERVLYAEAMLRMTGLTKGFARTVVLCAHGSRTANNPYASSLACGACGGNPGGANARTAAAILNRADVRSELASRGISLPADTWFVAAEHDTASDEIRILDAESAPAGHEEDLTLIGADLTAAGAHLAAERAGSLPGLQRGSDPVRHTRTRAADWSEVYPEWGLAGNAAFVIGPRRITAGVNLERRCFLHSYEAQADPEGTGLETILTAPVIVAQWINAGYYFSTVEPDVFGAGAKPIHNVTAGVGVVSGAGGDLRLGLPLQSVYDGTTLMHEPMRLLVLAQAPLDRIAGIIGRNTGLHHLAANEWITVLARESEAEDWMRWTAAGWRSTPAPAGRPQPHHSLTDHDLEVSAPCNATS